MFNKVSIVPAIAAGSARSRGGVFRHGLGGCSPSQGRTSTPPLADGIANKTRLNCGQGTASVPPAESVPDKVIQVSSIKTLHEVYMPVTLFIKQAVALLDTR